jgi:hypothetical protein
MVEEETNYFNSCLNTYYSLQNQYNSAFDKEKQIIIKKDALSWKEKRKLFKNIKPKCVNCKRPVGTIFLNRRDKETDERDLVATCGDKTSPCGLKIELHMEYTDNIYETLKTYNKEIQEFKKTIIQDKNNLLFGYITPSSAVQIFDNVKDDLVKTAEMYEYTQSLCFNIKNNPTKHKQLQELEKEYKTCRLQMKEIMTNLKLSNYDDEQKMREYIDVYIHRLLPTVQNMMLLKYQYRAVEYDETNKTYHLVQNTNSIQQMEWYLGDSSARVVSMQTGTGEEKIKQPRAKKPKPVVLQKKRVLEQKEQKEQDEEEENMDEGRGEREENSEDEEMREISDEELLSSMEE